MATKKAKTIEAAFQEYLAEHNLTGPISQKQHEEAFERFMDKQGMDFLMQEVLGDMDEDLQMAYEAENSEEALKCAKRALKKNPRSVDAETLIAQCQAKSEDDLQSRYRKILAKEEKNLKNDGIWEEENIGSFWLITATRPYMRLCDVYVDSLVASRKFRKAAEECEKMLRLCENDNLGVRYRLAHIYAYLEEEAALQRLQQRYENEDSTMFLLPLCVLYYKLDDLKTAASYLAKLFRINPDCKLIFRNADWEKIENAIDEALDEVTEVGGYRPASLGEFLLAIEKEDYLYDAATSFWTWAMQQCKKTERTKK